jgi:putative transposon-encoded protein
MSKQDWKIDTIAFEYIERKCGTSSHIIVPTPMVGKRVRVIVETLDWDLWRLKVDSKN